MINQRYVVKKGDCLWDISERYLGSPWEWHRIFSLNNRQSIVRLTGRGIANPDRIYPGQILYLPISPLTPPPPKPPKATGAKRPAVLKDQVRNISVPVVMAYKLDELPLMVYEDALVKATIKLYGKVTIRLAHKTPLVQVTNRGLEMVHAERVESVIGQMFSETKVKLDYDNKITYECNMVSRSTTPGAPNTAIGLVVTSDSPTPKLRGQIRFPKLSGYLGGNFYTAVNVKVVIDVEPKVTPVSKGPELVKYREFVVDRPVSVATTSESTVKWWLVGAGAAIMVGTILTDWTGVGMADDPLTLPTGAGMVARGFAGLTVPVVARHVSGFALRVLLTCSAPGLGMMYKSAPAH